MMRRSLVVLAVVGVVMALGAACDLSPDHTFVVDLATDLADADPGDGVCAVAAPAVGCTLRAAVDESNALHASTLGRAPIITVELATDPQLAIPETGFADNLGGDLDIEGSLDIVGNGHTVDANGIDRAFDVEAGSFILRDLTVTEGRASQSGGAVRTAPNTRLSVINTTFFGNSAGVLEVCGRPTIDSPICGGSNPQGGGALFVQGTAAVIFSTFHANTALPWANFCLDTGPGGWICPVTRGGAILATGNLYVGNSTFEANVNQGFHPDWEGGTAIYATGAAQVVSSTVTDNGLNAATAVTGAAVQHSIVASTGCAAPVLDAAGNLRSPAPCGAPAPVWLAPLGDHGGPTQTRVPMAGGPAVDALAVGDCLSYAIDQRGEPRPDAGHCDIGAVERQPSDP